MNSLLTVKEAAEMLKVSVSTIYRYCEQGVLPHIKKGFGLRFKFRDLEKWIDLDSRQSLSLDALLKNAVLTQATVVTKPKST